MELSDIKHQVNIVDIIGQYVGLKKAGANHHGLCPFHSEKTASFTVCESKQFYHCFGCGANGDVIKFTQDYKGLDFIEAVKDLGGGDDEYEPRNKFRFQSPRSAIASHRNDDPRVVEFISNCPAPEDRQGLKVYEQDGDFYLLIINSKGHKIGVSQVGTGDDKCLFGLTPINGFTPIRKNKSNNFIVCRNIYDGIHVSNQHNLNVAICYTDESVKYHCPWPDNKVKSRPLLTPDCSDFLITEMDYLWLENKTITARKKECIN